MGQAAFGRPLYDHDGSRAIFHGREVPFMDYSDHVFFNSGNVGVPTLTFIDLPYESHHSQNDELDKLDPTQLRRECWLAAAVAWTVVASGPEEAPAIIDEIFHRGRARLERDARLAGNVLRKAGPDELPPLFRTARNLISQAVAREARALKSAELFAAGDQNARARIADRIARTRGSEAGMAEDLRAIYEAACRRAGRPAAEPEFSPAERAWSAKIPVPNPQLHGTFGILNRPGERYAFDPFSPMSGFLYELVNGMDGRRNLLEIVEAARAQALGSHYPVYSPEEINRFLKLLEKDGVIEFRDKGSDR
jgi:hypothetical protein